MQVFVRVSSRVNASSYERFGHVFGQAWKTLDNVDNSFYRKLVEDQMLEVRLDAQSAPPEVRLAPVMRDQVSGAFYAEGAEISVGGGGPHNHPISAISGLQSELDSKADADHGHDLSNIHGLVSALEGKADDEHEHSISDISGLQNALDGKQNTLQNADVLGKITEENGLPKWGGEEWPGGTGGASDLFPLSRTVRMGFAGDSIGGAWSGDGGLHSSMLHWAAAEAHQFDWVIHMNTSVGGVSSTHLLTTQIAQLEAMAVKPDIVMVQTLQNDFFGDNAGAEALVANVTTYAARALAAGVKKVILCSRPPNTKADYSPSSVQHGNAVLKRWCESNKDAFYCDTFGAMAANNGVLHTNKVPFAGSAANRDLLSTDGTHPNVLGSRMAGLRSGIIEIIKRLTVPVSYMPSVAVARNRNLPRCNLLGPGGMMIGTGGEVNGVANANVAGIRIPEHWAWRLTFGDGITAVPTIVKDDQDGQLYQRITVSGTATQDTFVQFELPYFFESPNGLHLAECRVVFEELLNTRGIYFRGIPHHLLPQFDMTNKDAGDDIKYARLNHPMHFRIKGVVGNGLYPDNEYRDYPNKYFNLQLHIKQGDTVSGAFRVGRCGLFYIG